MTKLTRRHAITALAASTAAVALPRVARAQAFPSKPITLIVPFSPGGATDLTQRALARAVEPVLGQPVVIVNRPAGGGAQAMQEVARAAPDGYTLINFTSIQAAIAPHMRQVPYDSVAQFTPIMTYGAFNTFVAVRSESPFKSLKDVTDWAKANPRALTVGISVIGASSHLGMARLAQGAGAQVTFVPFGGGAPAVTALLGGHIGCIVVSGEILPQVKAGRVRLLANMMGKRAPEVPDVPSIRELGFDWDLNSWIGVAGPANMPAAVVSRLEQAFLKATEDRAYRQALAEVAVAQIPAGSAATREHLAQDLKFYETLLRGLKLGRYAN